MKEAVIVSTARTPIGKAYRGAFNNLESPTLASYAIRAAVERAGVEPGEIDDCIMGAAMQQGSQGFNVARQCAIRSELPVEVSGMTIDRQCSSGLMSIATAAKQITVDGAPVVIAGGLDSISLVQNEHMNGHRTPDPWIKEHKLALHMPMIDTAELVAKRYDISRDAQDQYGLQSQQRTAAAQEAGKFDDEIVPVKATKMVLDRETKEVSFHETELAQDEGNRPGTTLEGLTSLKPVREGGCITAGNASQLSDGASASVLMDSKLAEQRGLEPLGIYRGILSLVKQARDSNGNVLADGADVTPGQQIWFVLYIDNVTDYPAAGIRISDVLDESQFTYVTDSLESTTAPSGADDATLWASPWLAQTDALGAPDDIASITNTGGPPDKETLTVGDVTGQQNNPVTIPANTRVAVRFRVTVD